MNQATDQSTHQEKLSIALLVLRLTIFLVMLMWTVDKFVNPDHAIRVYEAFYFIPGVQVSIMTILAIIEMIILLMFLAGFMKKYTYGAVLIFHSFSTFSAYANYFNPFEGANLLFFAAWPMWGACLALFMLRDADTKLSVG